MWRLLFFAAVVVTASLPQLQSSGAIGHSECLRIHEPGEVIGITSLGETLAVASRATIYLYSVPDTTCRQLDEFSTPVIIDKLLTEFKLLNESSLFYCDANKCFGCYRKTNWTCKEHDIRAGVKTEGEIQQAVVTQSGKEKNTLRIVFAKGAVVIYTYDADGYSLLEEPLLLPMQTAQDVAYLMNQQTVLGFNVDGFTFFVSSSKQPYEPVVNKDKNRKDTRSIVKVTRICDRDNTSRLESRIDIALMCNNTDYNRLQGVSAAVYDDKERKVYISFSGAGVKKDTYTDSVCSFPIEEINRRVEHTWDLCQNYTYGQAISECEYVVRDEDIPEHCYIFTRLGDSNRMLACSRYSTKEELPKFDNCELDKYTSTAYRYGWLENYTPLYGTHIALVNNAHRRFNRLFLDREHRSLFFSSEDLVFRVQAQFDGYKDDQALDPTLFLPVWPSSRFNLAHVTSDSFLIIAKTEVRRYGISCPSLYASCPDLLAGGFRDHLECIFCSNEDEELGGHVIPKRDKASCKMPFFTSCPPLLDKATQKPGRKDQWVLLGTSLSAMSNSKVLVCNQSCDIESIEQGDTMLTCTLPSASIIDSSCGVSLVGQIEQHKQFTVQPRKASVDASSQTEKSNASSGTMSKGWKIVIGVIAVILIIAVIFIIILGARKYLGSRNNQKGSGSLGVPFDSINSYPRNPARNTYLSTDPSGMAFANPELGAQYERLFREIDPRLKIPSDQLLLERQIGKGHFGIVLKGTYKNPDGEEQSVACKTLSGNVSGGIGEFVNEGLMMDKFDHPRVMSLVGISFTEERVPIIVTEYMENGDLAKYLRNEKSKPTLRNLLVFELEIAEGMAYLHDNNFIHRDLAARNCMLDANLHIKIADFGLCREATNQEYAPLHHGRELPLRWMAPEALEHEQFTIQGDVWAYGVVLWEIMTRGMLPYQNLQAYLLLEYLKAGKRLNIPIYCPEILYEVMTDCWHLEPYLRPSFSELADRMNEIIHILETQGKRTQLNAEYEQSNSARSSRAISTSTATTPITHHTVSHVHSLPVEDEPDPTPV